MEAEEDGARPGENWDSDGGPKGDLWKMCR